MNEQLCRVLYYESSKKVIFESAVNNGLTLNQVIDKDISYGTMKPANGKYFTFKVLNEDQEFTKKEARRAMRYAQKRWSIWAKLPKFRLAKPGEIVDFRLEFRDTDTDPDKKLTDGTVMYHYYPISDINHRLRGLCVVNKKFFYTTHGNSVKGSFLESKGLKVQNSKGDYTTLDFDAIYGHELGHGLGLPHDPEEYNLMSFRVDIMAEFATHRDSSRMSSDNKYGKSTLSTWRKYRWLKWLFVASDR